MTSGAILAAVKALSRILPRSDDTASKQVDLKLEFVTVETVVDQLNALEGLNRALFVQAGVDWVRNGWTESESAMADVVPDLDLPHDLNHALSLVGWRATRFLRLLIAAFPSKVLDLTVADVVEFLSQVVDILTAADAAACVCILHQNLTLLRDMMIAEATEATSKPLLIARAVTVSVVVRILQTLQGTEWFAKWGARARFLAFLSLPANFDGIANKCRGREAPTVVKALPIYPITRHAEKGYSTLWERTLKFREQLGLPAPSLTFSDFLLFVKVNRFVQDPPEYVSQCLLEGPEAIRSSDIEDDEEREEGEEDEDDEDRALRRRQKQAEKHLHHLNLTDSFATRLEEVRKLAQLYRRRLLRSSKDKGGEQRDRDKEKEKEDKKHKEKEKEKDKDKESATAAAALSAGKGAPLDASALVLLQHAQDDPVAFIEIYEAVPEMLCLSAQMICMALKVHCEWPQRADEVCFLSKWAEKINPSISRIYRKTLNALVDVFSMGNGLDAQSTANWLFEEVTDTIGKYEGLKFPASTRWPGTTNESAMAEPPTAAKAKIPEGMCNRLARFNSEGLPSIRAVLQQDTTRIEPLPMTEMREEFYLDTPLPPDFDKASVTEKIQQRYLDYQGKMAMDRDPAYGVEAEYRLLASCMNQWRVLRVAFLSSSIWNDSFISRYTQPQETLTTGSEEGAAAEQQNPCGLLAFIHSKPE